jgi:phage gp45-like
LRATTRDVAHRVYLALTRGVLMKADDNHLLQQTDIELFAEQEQKIACERFQEYGFSSYPIQQAQQQQGQGGAGGQGGGQSSNGGGNKGTYNHPAEIMLGCLNGIRNHAVVFHCDDRRHRLKNQQEGEVAIYDDQFQRVQLRRDQIWTEAPKPNKIVSVVVKETRDYGKDPTGQDAQEQHTPLTRVTQTSNKITSEILDDKGEKTLTIVTQEQQTITLEIRDPNTQNDVIKVKQDNADNPGTITMEVLNPNTANDLTKITQDKQTIKFEVFDDNGNVVTSLVLDHQGIHMNAPDIDATTNTMTYSVQVYSIYGKDIGCYGPSHGWYP